MKKAAAPCMIALVLCLLAACAPQEKIPTLKEGFAQYNARQVEQSEDSAGKIIAANPDAPTIDEAYYLRGLSRMARGNRIGAAADLNNAISKSTRTDLKSKAWYALGDIAFDQGKWAEAQKDYSSALDIGGSSPSAIIFLNYSIGLCLQAQGDWTGASAWFARVVNAKDAKYAPLAVARLHLTSFALQFGAFQEAVNARNLVTQLKPLGVTAEVAVDVREGKVLYLVQSGAYHTLAQASAARDAISTKYALVRVVPDMAR